MTVLITGANGFVGSAVVRASVAAGNSVRALTRADSSMANLAHLDAEKLTRVIGDLRDPASLERAVDGCDAVFHVAADYRLWAPDSDAMYATNVAGTRHLLAAARRAGVGRMVYTSSVATLGLSRDGSPADESLPVSLADMIGHYKRSKFLAEALALKEAREDGFPVVIVNPTAPVGGGDIRPTPTGAMVRDATLGRMPAYVDTGLNIVHVDDVAAGHLQAMQRGRIGERYILGSENMTLADILACIAQLTGRPAPWLKLPRAPLLPVAWLAQRMAALSGREPRLTTDAIRMAGKRMFFTSAKARRELGYTPRPAADALRDAVTWFLARCGE